MTSKDLPKSSAPDPWPQEPRSDGALYGDLPIEVPRATETNTHITIHDRKDGVTYFRARQANKQHIVEGKIDTAYERFIFNVTLYQVKGQDRMRIGSMDLGRAVALQGPLPSDPSRVFADHADGDALNNTAANLHWVTPSFNNFNRKKKRDSNGFVRVKKRGNRFTPEVAGIGQGSYHCAETAALAYNLVCRHLFGDQLDKTPHLLNAVPNENTRSSQVAVMPTGAIIHRIDGIFVIFYHERIQPDSKHATLQAAQDAAKKLVADLDAKKIQAEADWKEKEKKLKVTDREDDAAFIATSSGARVLVSDDTWKKVRARESASGFKTIGLTSSLTERPKAFHAGLWALDLAMSSTISIKTLSTTDWEICASPITPPMHRTSEGLAVSLALVKTMGPQTGRFM